MSRHEIDDAGADWAGVSQLIERAGVRDDVRSIGEIDVARLRRSVRQQLGTATPAWRRYAAAVAAFAVGGTSLFAVLSLTPQVSALAEVDVDRAADGSVLLKFNDGGTHRIVKTDDPAAREGQVKVAKGRTFVDKAEEVRPGAVVFYRID